MITDKVTIERIKLLHPKIREAVNAVLCSCLALGIEVRIVQGFRSFAEQDALYAQGRTIPGHIVTKARGGQSPHNFGLAVDFCIHHKDGTVSFDMHEGLDENGISDWNRVVNEFKKFFFEWGGDWKGNLKDNDHVQLLFGYSLVKLLELYNSAKFDSERYVLLNSNIA